MLRHTHTKKRHLTAREGGVPRKYSEEKSRNPSGMALSLRLQSLAFNWWAHRNYRGLRLNGILRLELHLENHFGATNGSWRETFLILSLSGPIDSTSKFSSNSINITSCHLLCCPLSPATTISYLNNAVISYLVPQLWVLLLQCIFHAATRMICFEGRSNHIPVLMKTLQWLPKIL